MRRASITIVALAFALPASPALAEPTPAYGSLPVAHVIKPPEKAAMPARIDGHPRIDGVFVAPPSKEELRQMQSSGYRQVQVFTTEKRARDATQGRFSGEDEDATGACLVTHQDFDDGGDGWSPMFQTQASLSVSRPSAELRRRGVGVSGGVDAVRVESLVRDGSKARLEATSALVDPDTAGAKLLERSTMPLALVAKGPGGVEVYGARDDGLVHFVVTSPRLPEKIPAPALPFVRSMARRMSAQLPAAFRTGHSDCGHFRTWMIVEKGSGQMVTVQATILSPSDEVEAPLDDGSPAQLQALRTLKKRALLVHLSVSQSSSDKEPVLSVSFAWAGKEADQPF